MVIAHLCDRCIVLGMKSAGIAALILIFTGCGGRTSSWSPNAVRLPITLRVGQGVMEGLRVHYVKPAYPGYMQKQGDVVVWFWIDKSGAVGNVRAIEGDQMLLQPAMDAVKQWRYTPYLLNGKPVEVETIAVVSFGK
ncbi:MAG: energy transducer TonB [Candidatus Angelobacter sp.]